MIEPSVIRDVLRQFDLAASDVEPRGNAGGFSGSLIFKVNASDQSYCLKRWPESTQIEKLVWIHRVLIFVVANGCGEVVTPLSTTSGKTIVQNPQGVWELTKWSAGKPNYLEHPHESKLKAGLDFLARFHQAAARFFFNFARSDNVGMSCHRLDSFQNIVASVRPSDPSVINLPQDRFSHFVEKGRGFADRLRDSLLVFRNQQLPVHPVIRDIRAEHLFYENQELVAVIDYGAMRIDSVACDLARMLGDCCQNQNHCLSAGLDHYHSIRPLSEVERNLTPLLHQATIIVGLLNWIEWLGIQQRQFDDHEKVRTRLNSLFDQFESLDF